ncbi:von Hippel-Lindau tumor suppressor homolog [Phymastichus coffea]|uniref:von Hippel-Lindau tumor suppressor homolog n=1 Tax=Phymastichus coffea TaxID=108790 RepID=UPI00273C3E95|nr:von Hippel-Lindau tumor suppressor homolog [Phymastichus coffea]
MEEEQQENREQLPELRSIHNRQSSFVKFINMTSYNVNVYWIDYAGKEVAYKVLGCQDYIDINTFVTHPWIFVEEETKDRLLGNGQPVYFPEAWFERYRGLRQQDLPARRIERTVVYISLPMYSLRELALRAIKRRLRYDEHAQLLEIPKTLRDELATMEPRKPAPEKSSA